MVKHVPVLDMSGHIATVSVGATLHPMTADHYISAAWLVDQNGQTISWASFNYSTSAVAVASMTVPLGVTAVTPYAHCNLHGVWVGDATQLDVPIVAPCPPPANTVQLSPDVTFAWTVLADGSISVTATLSRTAWLAVGASKIGKMPSSKVVIGSASGVSQYTLGFYNSPSPDTDQTLISSSFTVSRSVHANVHANVHVHAHVHMHVHFMCAMSCVPHAYSMCVHACVKQAIVHHTCARNSAQLPHTDGEWPEHSQVHGGTRLP